jgi:hypothetical protein
MDGHKKHKKTRKDGDVTKDLLFEQRWMATRNTKSHKKGREIGRRFRVLAAGVQCPLFVPCCAFRGYLAITASRHLFALHL